jgi:hypothetical protein
MLKCCCRFLTPFTRSNCFFYYWLGAYLASLVYGTVWRNSTENCKLKDKINVLSWGREYQVNRRWYSFTSSKVWLNCTDPAPWLWNTTLLWVMIRVFCNNFNLIPCNFVKRHMRAHTQIFCLNAYSLHGFHEVCDTFQHKFVVSRPSIT